VKAVSSILTDHEVSLVHKQSNSWSNIYLHLTCYMNTCVLIVLCRGDNPSHLENYSVLVLIYLMGREGIGEGGYLH